MESFIAKELAFTCPSASVSIPTTSQLHICVGAAHHLRCAVSAWVWQGRYLQLHNVVSGPKINRDLKIQNPAVHQAEITLCILFAGVKRAPNAVVLTAQLPDKILL